MGMWAKRVRVVSALPPSGDLGSQQSGQHLWIGQLPAGCGVQGVVRDLHGLLEAESLQVLWACSKAIISSLLRWPVRAPPGSAAPSLPQASALPPPPGEDGRLPWAGLTTDQAG